jgi:hypothetical protein
MRIAAVAAQPSNAYRRASRGTGVRALRHADGSVRFSGDDISSVIRF